LAGGSTFVAHGFCNHASDSVAAAEASLDRGPQEPQWLTSGIKVEVATGAALSDLRTDWLDLSARADTPNVFMNPELVRIAGDTYSGERCLTLLAWQHADGRRRLVGVWAFAVGLAPRSICPVPVLKSPPFPHAYLATPVIDRTLLDVTFDAMLECIATNDSLPKFVVLDALTADGATPQVLQRVLAARHGASCTFRQATRPKLASTLDGKQYLEKALSSSSRKKLRQHRRRLAEKGALESRIATEPAAVRAALEEFLQMEASGWKGRQRTALVSQPADAAFVRTMVGTLAERGEASIHGLYLDGHPVSLQIVLRAGPAAFTWKTAYDEAMHDFSPGMLLLEDYTAAFLADRSIAFVDSCAYDDSGFMSVWSERQAIANVWLDARRGKSIAFAILMRLQEGYLALRAVAKKAYLARLR
jgi:CelD/BcsL family acetyltransferase involved in cellulose biosynthesis